MYTIRTRHGGETALDRTLWKFLVKEGCCTSEVKEKEKAKAKTPSQHKPAKQTTRAPALPVTDNARPE